MVYKIGLISTHGTGKTALAGLVEGELKRRGIEALALKEASTKARERGLPINEQTTLEAQLWILHYQFAEELRYSQERPIPPNYQVILCDRGPDNYCYLKHRFGEDEYALQMTLGHMKKFPYNRFYLLPIIKSPLRAGAGIRSLDPFFQEAMDGEIRAFLNEHALSHTELPAPQSTDNFRDEWLRIIVNQTLKDLHVSEEYHMK